MSKKQLINNLDLFGFGQSLFINLPGSKNGSLPSPNSLSESDHFSIGYGYGLSVSLMHLVNAYTILANIGSQTQLKYISNTYPDDNKQVLDVQISNTILDMMSEVVHSPDGTGKKASCQYLPLQAPLAPLEEPLSSSFCTRAIVCAFSVQEKTTNGMLLRSTTGTPNKEISTIKR